MRECDLPAYDADEFTTRVDSLEDTPGFFPVHSGRLPEGLSASSAARRIVIFGTDWGCQDRAEQCRQQRKARQTCRCQHFRRKEKGKKPYATEGNLYEVLTHACLDAKKVFLTNAVLGLAKKKQSGNTPLYGRHPTYLRECGHYHRRCLRNVEKPGLAVLMGEPHLQTYGCGIWSVVWPELFGPGGVWAGTNRLADAFEADRTVATAADGWRVQLMYHPAWKHTQPRDAWQRIVQNLRREGTAVEATVGVNR